MLLYTLYDAPLIRTVNPDDKRETIVGFVDDTTRLVTRKDFDETHRVIKDMMGRKNGVFDWFKASNSPLEMNKLTIT